MTEDTTITGIEEQDSPDPTDHGPVTDISQPLDYVSDGYRAERLNQNRELHDGLVRDYVENGQSLKARFLRLLKLD